MYKVFIDGSAGTTGLKIAGRLAKRKDVSLITLSEEFRKDISARRDALNSADVAFLCLPDAAAIEAVSLIENDKVKVIDTSTAHRVNPEWTYGFPELKGKRELIKKSNRIANPGCHASGVIALINPLVECGVLDKSVKFTAVSLTGYTGGGKKMILEYEGDGKPELYNAPRQYGLGQNHKHLPEIKAVCGLNDSPVLMPIVSDFDRGMEVTVPLFKKDINGSVEDIKKAYADLYTDKVVKYAEGVDEGGFLSAGRMKGKDGMEISVFGSEDKVLLVSRFDNLGKGASGAAIQNMNILLGVPETEGLIL